MAISWNQGITLKHRSVMVILKEATVIVQTWSFLVSWHGPWWSQGTYGRRRVLPFETHFLSGISIRQAFDWHRYLEDCSPHQGLQWVLEPSATDGGNLWAAGGRAGLTALWQPYDFSFVESWVLTGSKTLGRVTHQCLSSPSSRALFSTVKK